MDALRPANMKAGWIGVIVPYRAQVAEIRRQLSPHPSPVMVDAIDRFQSSEREIIVISLTQSSVCT